jgi:hypothetical protein
VEVREEAEALAESASTEKVELVEVVNRIEPSAGLIKVETDAQVGLAVAGVSEVFINPVAQGNGKGSETRGRGCRSSSRT